MRLFRSTLRIGAEINSSVNDRLHTTHERQQITRNECRLLVRQLLIAGEAGPNSFARRAGIIEAVGRDCGFCISMSPRSTRNTQPTYQPHIQVIPHQLCL